MDSGCTNHMNYDERLFKHLNRSLVSKVKFGNDTLVNVISKGEVVVDTPKGTKIIYDMLYVPEISENLLSVGQMLEKVIH